MKTPDEIQLSSDLRTIVADPPFAPDVEAIARHGRRRLLRHVAVRGLAGVAVISVAVAGGLVAVGHGSGAAHEPAAAKPTTGAVGKAAKTAKTGAARMETVAYVRQRIEAALNPDAYLVDMRQSSGDPSNAFTAWTDPRTGNTMLLRGSGYSRVAYWEHDFFLHRVLHWDQTQVNYGPRTWWTFDEHAGGPIQGPVPSGPVGGGYYSPNQIKQIFDDGAKIVGHPYIDGHHTIEIAAPKGTERTDTIYADATTYQLVRTVTYFPTSLQSTPDTDDYIWAPRSAAMVYRINHPQIPAGYTQIPAD